MWRHEYWLWGGADTRLRRRVSFFLPLMGSRELPVVAKPLYVVAEAMQPRSVSELARLAGVERNAASAACGELVRAGWMRLVKSGKTVMPIAVVPPALQTEQIANLRKALAMAQHKGEFLMKRWLDLTIDSDDYVDNARPDFLSNPASGEALEFDRYYMEGVAFEFNGPQHYGPTTAYPDERVFKETRMRDLLKAGLSHEQGVVLVTMTAQDLSLEGVLKKVPGRLRRAYVDRESPYVKALERVSADYRRKANAGG